MLYELRLKLTSEMLGDQQTPDRVRRFNRPKSMGGKIALNIPQWTWAIGEAIQALHLDQVDPGRVMMERQMRAPTLQLYTRRWSKTNGRTGKKVQKQEMFESIGVGAELGINLMVSEHPAPGSEKRGLQAPTQDELRQIFSLIGSLMGISPWGAGFGYGRFDVLDVRPA